MPQTVAEQLVLDQEIIGSNLQGAGLLFTYIFY